MYIQCSKIGAYLLFKLIKCEDMMGTIFVSMSVRAREVNRYTEMHICEYVDETVDNVGAPAFTVQNEKVCTFQFTHFWSLL